MRWPRLEVRAVTKNKITTFLFENKVVVLFVFLCIGGTIASGQSMNFVVSELFTRIARNSFLVLALIIPVLAGLGLNFGIVIGAMAGQIGVIFVRFFGLGGIGGLLLRGIGDTIRVSLTDEPVKEVRAGIDLLRAIDLRRDGPRIVSCPTCGRTKIDLIALANQVEKMVEDIPLDIKVAVMGCVVNGPGEAKEADIGIAGGIGEGLLIRKGEVVKKVKEDQLLETLRQELLSWNE